MTHPQTNTTLMDGTLAWVALPFAAPRYLAAFMRLHGIARIMCARVRVRVPVYFFWNEGDERKALAMNNNVACPQ